MLVNPKTHHEEVTEEDVQQDWQEFWAPIVTTNGTVDFSKVARELYDYHMLMQEAAKVYNHVTQGRISKPNTMAFEVIGEHDAVCHRDCAEPE